MHNNRLRLVFLNACLELTCNVELGHEIPWNRENLCHIFTVWSVYVKYFALAQGVAWAGMDGQSE